MTDRRKVAEHLWGPFLAALELEAERLRILGRPCPECGGVSKVSQTHARFCLDAGLVAPRPGVRFID